MQSLTFTVRWDSTHFQHGSGETIECKATCGFARVGAVPVTGPAPILETGSAGPAVADVQVSVYNYGFAGEISKAIVMGDQTVPTVASYMVAMNHHADTAENLDQYVCAGGSETSTLYYYLGHGVVQLDPNPPHEIQWTAVASLDPAPAWFVFDLAPGFLQGFNWDFLDFRKAAATLGLPPMNFAFIDGCGTGICNRMADALLYPVDASIDEDGGCRDRAEMGWKIDASWDWALPFTGRFFSALSGGETVGEARKLAFAGLTSYLQDNPKLEQLPVGATPKTVIGLWGDQQTRVFKLYTETDDGPVSFWYEVEVSQP